jgi:tRNA-2-methylthio-N6-dimethylallyladenosine synthase
MNFSDSEVVASILAENGFNTTNELSLADVVLVNTCAIRDNAEQRVRTRIRQFNKVKEDKPEAIIGVLGCMAERLKTKFLDEEKLVDLVIGPDAYRDLPTLIATAESGQKAVNVLLSREETYADVSPVRLNSNGVSAFVSITRGCDNMCSFCVVPFTRGRERSRDPKSIIKEVQTLVDTSYKEVTLLGQNVDSYKWIVEGEECNFAQLLEKTALVAPDLRVRFSTSHPKDMTDEVLHTMAKYPNICDYIHLPVQSGNSEVLEKMNRGYTREWYMNRIDAIKRILPNATISTDIITGFCSETEEQHKDTLSLVDEVKFTFAYMYTYSERPNTLAERKYKDDVPEKVKSRRLSEIIDLQRGNALKLNQKMVGKTYEVLIEKLSKKSDEHLSGRNSQNVVIIFPKGDLKPGMYANVKALSCTSATLIGEVVD